MVDVAIVVDSASLDVREGETVNLKATVVDSDGNPVEGARIEWASENSEIAEVTADGTLTAKQPGTVELTASTYGSSWDFRAWIRSLPRSIAIVAGDEQEGAPGETLPELLTVRLLDRKGRPTGGVPVTFSVTAGGGTAGPMSTVTDVEGRISAMWTLGESGEQRLEARVHQDHARVMKRSSVAFTAIAQEQQTEDPPVSLGQVTIDVPADTVLEIGASATLQATARDAVGSLIEDADIQWSSSNPDILTVDDMGRLVAKAAGAVLITAAAAGCASDTQRMVVEPPPVEAENPAAVTDLTVGDVNTSSVTLRWTAVSDGAGDVAKYAIRYGSPTLSWGSAYETEVSVDADSVGQAVSYTYSGLADGTDYQFRLVSYRGTLNQGAIFGDYSNSVSAATEVEQGGEPEPDVASVTATPGSHTFTAVGQSLQIEATARDAGGTVVSGAGFTWASTNSSVVSVNSMGLVTARGLGTAMIVVTSVCCGAADTVMVNVEGQEPPPSSGEPFFEDNFDNGRKSNANGFSWIGASPISNTESYSGAYSMLFPNEGVPDGGDTWAEERFVLAPDAASSPTEIWVEFMWYVPANYRHRNSSGPDNNKFFTLWAENYSASNEAQFFLSLERGASDNETRLWAISIHGDDPRWANHTYWDVQGNGGVFVTPADYGTWHQIRIHARLAVDGEIHVWKNGQEIVSIEDYNMVRTNYDRDYFRHGYLMGWANSGYSQDTSFYIDDIKFYRVNPGW